MKTSTPRKLPARKRSAGLLLHRNGPAGPEVLLAHPGGPFWQRKDAGAWSIPKGEIEAGEDELAAARREVFEETGLRVESPPHDLGSLRQPGGKIVHAFAVAADWDPAELRSNTFKIEWPPRSGRIEAFPEIDRAAWFDLEAARSKILKGQVPFLDRLAQMLTS